MATLRLNVSENASLEAALEKMEALFGSEYSFEPEMSEFSCRCSGPAQSCIKHLFFYVVVQRKRHNIINL